MSILPQISPLTFRPGPLPLDGYPESQNKKTKQKSLIRAHPPYVPIGGRQGI